LFFFLGLLPKHPHKVFFAFLPLCSSVCIFFIMTWNGVIIDSGGRRQWPHESRSAGACTAPFSSVRTLATPGIRNTAPTPNVARQVRRQASVAGCKGKKTVAIFRDPTMSVGFRSGAGKTPVTGAGRALQSPMRYKRTHPRKHRKIHQLRALSPKVRYKIA
jgi:hypothetical protein